MRQKFIAWWPSVLTVLTGAASFMAPSVQAYITNHPEKATAIATVWMLVLHQLKSPLTICGGTK